MMLEPSRTFRRARLTTIALATAAFITLSDSALAQRADRPPLDVPYVPTPPEVVERMLEMATVRPEDFVIDLGSGDGRIAIAAARKGARALGIDIDPERVLEAQDNARKAGVQDRAQFKRQNLFDARLSDATVVTMYLLTKVNLDLRPRILESSNPERASSRIPSTWAIGNPISIPRSDTGRCSCGSCRPRPRAAGPAQSAPQASASICSRSISISTGSAEIASKTLAVREGWLHGTEMHLTLSDGRKLRGRIDGDRMQSLPVDARDKPAISWHAIRQS